jgi:hypothetical protein
MSLNDTRAVFKANLSECLTKSLEDMFDEYIIHLYSEGDPYPYAGIAFAQVHLGSHYVVTYTFISRSFQWEKKPASTLPEAQETELKTLVEQCITLIRDAFMP